MINKLELTNRLINIYIDNEQKNDLLTKYIEFAKDITGFENGFIAFIDEQYYEIIQAITIDDKLKKGAIFNLCDTLCQEVIDKGEAVFHCALKGLPQYNLPGRAFLNTQSVIGYPLYVEGEVWGTFTLCSTSEQSKDIYEKYKDILTLNATMIARYVQDISLKEQILKIENEKDEIYQLLEKRMYEQNALLKAIPDWIYRIDKNGVILDFIIGDHLPVHPIEDLVGNSLSNILDKEKAEKALSVINECLSTKKVITYEYDINTNGSVRVFEARVSFIDEDKVIFIVKDITELKNKNADLKALFNAIPDWLYKTNSKGVVTYCKQGYYDTLLDAEDFIGKSVFDFLDKEIAEKAVSNIQQCLKTQQVSTFEYKRVQDGKIRYFEARITFVKENEVIAIVRDISESKNTENFLKQTQKIAKIGGWALDVATQKTQWTQQIYDIYGIEKDIETNIEIGINQYHKNDQDRITNAVSNCIQKQIPFDEKLRFNQANGNEIWVRSIGYPIMDINGKTIAVQGTFQDIDKEERVRIKLKKEQETFSFLIKHTPSAIAMFDTQMNYIAHSKRWLIDYNLGDQEIIGKSHYEVFPDIPDRWKQNHQDVLNGEIYRNDEDKWERENGNTFYIRYELRPWYNDNEEIGGIIMFTEVITNQVENRLNLEKTVEELMRSNVDLEQFAFVASHDLQQPLRMIGNFSELLQIKYAHKIDNECAEYLNIISDSASRMKELINNLLNYSRVGRKESEFNNTNINTLVNNKLKDLALVIKERNAEISTNISTKPIKCEASQIGLVFYNLISNGIKFNKSKIPKIQINQKENKTHHLFEIVDNGIGLPKKYEEKAFKIFQRLQINSDFNGTGIGLALCKKIIERHNGEITYSENLEKGTTFLFSIKKM